MLQVKDLKVEFQTERGILKALRGVDLTVRKGEVVGIVGESGSGKSVTAMSIAGLMPKNVIRSGEIFVDDLNILELNKKDLTQLRGNKISMIFQEPGRSFDPLYTIGKAFQETLKKQNKHFTKNEIKEKSILLLKEVGIPNPEERITNYPHQLSGGQLQRVMIALALASDPDYLIADEPTTALDVTIQYRIIKLLKELKEKRGLSIIFITHDLSLIRGIADRILVFYAGLLLEGGKTEDVLKRPRHPYTRALLDSIPVAGSHYKKDQLISIQGNVPDPVFPPEGCPFSPRCSYVVDSCREGVPLIIEDPDRVFRCTRGGDFLYAGN